MDGKSIAHAKGLFMRTHRSEAVVEHNGTVVIRDVPFKAGERVEAILIEEQSGRLKSEAWQKLRGTVLRYDDPDSPVADDEWDALK